MKNRKIGVVSVGALAAVLGLSMQVSAQQPIAADLPPNARPGECYARVAVPAQFRTTTENVLKRAASEKIEVVPARFVQVDEQVMIKPATTRIETIPPVLETVEERVMVKPATTRLESVAAVLETVEERVLVKPETKRVEQVPATFESVTERVLVKPATMVWKKGRGPIQRVDDATGEIMCLVEEPAVYRDVTRTVVKTPATTREVVVPAEYQVVRKQVVKSPATTREVPVPAEYQTIRKLVVKTPAQTREVPVPAEFRTVKVTKLADAAREVRTPIPAEYQTVEKTQKVSEGRVEWRSILCDTNMTQDKIRQIQRALATAGFSPGPIDGVISNQTMNAVNAYQRAKNLPVDRFLNIDTVRALGVSPT
jgi:hypothetical protein